MSTHRPAAGALSHVPLLLRNPTPCHGKEVAKAIAKQKKQVPRRQGTPVLQPPILERFPLGRRRLVNLRRSRRNHRVKIMGSKHRKKKKERPDLVGGVHGGGAGTARTGR